MVGVLLAGEVHLYTAEIVHHHEEVIRVCQNEHRGGRYLHAAQDVAPLCPLCQIVRSSSVRPAVQSSIQKPNQECTYQLVTPQSRYSPKLPQLLLARGPPLS